MFNISLFNPDQEGINPTLNKNKSDPSIIDPPKNNSVKTQQFVKKNRSFPDTSDPNPAESSYFNKEFFLHSKRKKIENILENSEDIATVLDAISKAFKDAVSKKLEKELAEELTPIILKIGNDELNKRYLQVKEKFIPPNLDFRKRTLLKKEVRKVKEILLSHNISKNSSEEVFKKIDILIEEIKNENIEIVESLEKSIESTIVENGNDELVKQYFNYILENNKRKRIAELFVKHRDRETTTLPRVLLNLIKEDIEGAKWKEDFRGNTFGEDCCNSYFAIELGPQLKNLSIELLTFCKPLLSKIKNTDPMTVKGFKKFCKEGLNYIYSSLEFPESTRYLMQKKYKLLKNKFPNEAIILISDSIFLRTLLPYLSILKNGSIEEQKVMLSFSKVLQKIATGCPDTKHEKINSIIASYIPKHQDYLKKQMEIKKINL